MGVIFRKGPRFMYRFFPFMAGEGCYNSQGLLTITNIWNHRILFENFLTHLHTQKTRILQLTLLRWCLLTIDDRLHHNFAMIKVCTQPAHPAGKRAEGPQWQEADSNRQCGPNIWILLPYRWITLDPYQTRTWWIFFKVVQFLFSVDVGKINIIYDLAFRGGSPGGFSPLWRCRTSLSLVPSCVPWPNSAGPWLESFEDDCTSLSSQFRLIIHCGERSLLHFPYAGMINANLTLKISQLCLQPLAGIGLPWRW